MPVTYEWDNAEQTVMRYDLDATWTWEEARQAMSESWVLIAQRGVTVDSLATSQSVHLPPQAMPHLKALTQNRPANAGMMVLVGPSTFIKTMFGIFTTVYSNMLQRDAQVVFADSLDEARDIIRHKQFERERIPNP